MNPYTNRVPIQDPDEFYNRKTEVEKTFMRIGGSRPQCISIVGETRIGKSSLLYHIANKSVRKKHLGDDSEDYIFVFCDLQEKSNMDVSDFFFLVTKKIDEEAPGYFEKPIPEKMTFDSFSKLIQGLEKRGKKVILILDEFNVVTNNEKFGREFFSYLRSIASKHDVAYITSSRKDLQELCHTQGIKDSPFFNIFTHMHLGLFERESARELISVPSKREGIPLEDYAEFVFELAGYHPFFIQIACSNLFEHLKEGQKVVRKKFYEEAEDHFEYMWYHMDSEDEKCLKAIAESKELDRKLRFLAGKLAKRGVLIEEDGIYEIFSDCFKDFILKEIQKEEIYKR